MVGAKEKKRDRACSPVDLKRAPGKPCSASSHRSFRPSFFKIMLDNFEEVLFIPPKLTNVLLGLVNQNVHLKDFNANIWRVKVSMIDNSLAFEEGWKDFVLDHSISIGEFLLFKYVSKGLFSVKIYGTSACERIDFDKRNGNTFSKMNISKADLFERSRFAKRSKVNVASDAKNDSEEKDDPSSFAKRPMEDASKRNIDKADLSPKSSLPDKPHKPVEASNTMDVSEEKYKPNSAEVLVQDFCEKVGRSKGNGSNSSKKKRKETDLSTQVSEFSRQHKLAVASDSKEDSKEKHVPVEAISERVGLGKRNENNSSKKNRKKNDSSPERSQFSLQCKQNVSSNPKKDFKEKHGAAKNACARVGSGKRNRNNSTKIDRENTNPTKAACTKLETNDKVTCSQKIISDMVKCKYLLADGSICHIVSKDSMNRLGAAEVTPACLSNSEFCTKIKGSDLSVGISRDVTSNHESIPNVNCVAPVLMIDLQPEENSNEAGCFSTEEFSPLPAGSTNVNYVAPVPIIDVKLEENCNESGCLISKEFSPLVGSVQNSLLEIPVTANTRENACRSEDDKKEEDASLIRSQDHESVKVKPVDFSSLYSSDSYSFSLTSTSNSQVWIELPQQLLFKNWRKKTQNKPVILRDPLLREWPVLYYQTFDLAAFTSGWYDFARANNLQQGSNCEFFETIGDDFNLTFLVLITHSS